DQCSKKRRRTVVAAKIGDPVIHTNAIEAGSQVMFLGERRKPRALEIVVADDLEIQAARIKLGFVEREIENIHARRQNRLRYRRKSAISAEGFDPLLRLCTRHYLGRCRCLCNGCPRSEPCRKQEQRRRRKSANSIA